MGSELCQCGRKEPFGTGCCWRPVSSVDRARGTLEQMDNGQTTQSSSCEHSSEIAAAAAVQLKNEKIHD